MLEPSEPWPLHLSLFGPPQVYHHGRQLAFPSRKVLALLIYLAVEGKIFSRKTLSELFWPESDAAHARTTLRVTVLELRETLNENASLAKENGILHLLVERETLQLDLTSRVSLDLHTLDAAWALAQNTSHMAAPLPEEERRVQQAQLQEAICLVRGEFLADFALNNVPRFDDWTRFQREYWHVRLHLVFDRLSQLYEEAHEIEQAIATTSRWLAFSPLDEEASQRLMRLHFATGDRIAALQVYEALKDALASEFNARPTRQTEDLAESMRASISLPPERQQVHLSLSTLPRLLDTSLVGREREYETLLKCYHTACSGQAQVVMVTGEVGMGKTRLATAFTNWAVTQGAEVLHGQAFESSGRLSYQPLIEALRPRIDRENAPDDLLHDVWLAELTRLLPELRERYPDLPRVAADLMVARNHLFEAVARLLEALATRTPLLLFLDDLHWADTATLDLLHYLARNFTGRATPVLLLLSLSTGPFHTPSHLATWRANLGRMASVTHLELGPLSVQDIARLLQTLITESQRKAPTKLENANSKRLLMGKPLKKICERLFAETGGQPFYLIETLKMLLERSSFLQQLSTNGMKVNEFAAALVKELEGNLVFPPSVRELINLQLDQLSPNSLAFLVAGAILKQEATFERLCLIAELSEKEGLAALDEVLRSHLVQEPKQKGDQVYIFRHNMIREIVYAGVSETRNRIYHRRAFAVLQETSIPPAKLAYHALSAGLQEYAFRLSMAAGDEAMTVFALHDAIEHYEQAWWLLTNQPDEYLTKGKLLASEVQHLYVSLSRACKLTRAWEPARPVYGAMLEYMLRATAHDPSTIDLTKTEWYQAMIDMYTLDLTAAITHGEQVLTLARSLEEPDLIVQSLDMLIYMKTQLGTWEENEKLATEAYALYVVMKDQAMQANCLCLLANAHLHQGQPHAGIMCARSALITNKEIKNVWGQINAMYELTTAYLDIGAYEDALDTAQKAVESARTLSTRSSRANTLLLRGLIQLGNTYRALQLFSEAREADLEALKLNEELLSQPYTTLVSTVLCADYTLSDKWAEAHRYARQALTSEGNDTLLYAGIPQWCVIKALLHNGDIEAAQQRVSHMRSHNRNSRRNRVEYLKVHAIVTQSKSHIKQAVTYLEEARSLAAIIDLPGELWQIQALLAEVYELCGEQILADQAYIQAGIGVEELAHGIKDETLRDNFLKSPQIQQVLTKKESRASSTVHGHEHSSHATVF